MEWKKIFQNYKISTDGGICLYRVIKYINSNLHTSISVEETAERFGYSKWYFCEAFKRYTGQTFVEYVRRIRMQKAALDVLDGKKVLEVALAYGYDTPSGFNKAFIKQFGCYPTEYRKISEEAKKRYEERKRNMFMLTDRCAMLRDKTINFDKEYTYKICAQRTYHYAKGCVAQGKASVAEILGGGLAEVIRSSSPIIREGELLVGYNFGDSGYEGYALFNNPEETKQITDAMGLSDSEVEWLKQNIGSYLNNCEFDTSFYPREGKEWGLSMECAAVGRCVSFNHSVIGYEEVLKHGFSGLLERVEQYKAINGDTPFYRGIEKVCRAAMEIGERYAAEAEKMALTAEKAWADDLKRVADVCRRVPKYPAQTFHEAIQSLLFAHYFNTWEDGINANSLGRLDQILYPYYQKDIAEGRLTQEEAFELICCLWIKLYRNYDVQQSCVGGIKPDGSDAVNELSWMMLDATEALGFVRCISVRYSPRTDRAFLRRALEVVGHVQKGVPFFFNDDVLIPALERHGIKTEDARDYTQIGCVETVIPGKSNPHAVSGITNVLKALEYTVNNGKSIAHPDWVCGTDFGDVTQMDYKTFKDCVFAQMDEMLRATCNMYTMDLKPARTNEYKPIKSLLTKGCIESGRDFNDDGPLYNYCQVMLCGIPNLADSFIAIKKLVFDENRYTMEQVVDAMKNDYPDEAMRQDFLNKAPKFGNDIPEVDEIASEIMDYCCERLEHYSEVFGQDFHAQPFTFLDMILHGANTAASPDGRKAGEPIAYSASPMQGRDFNGFTALINSLCALPTKKAPGTTSAIVEVDPKLFTDSNLDLFTDIMLAAAENGLSNVQFNTVDADTLIDAQKHPEKYNNLAVRVSGFSQKFNLLDKNLQNHIIGRTKHATI